MEDIQKLCYAEKHHKMLLGLGRCKMVLEELDD